MELTLIRHAIAEPGADDAARALTPEGRARFRTCAKTLAALGLRFERVLHSPRRRAVQTAELLVRRCGGQLEETPLLAQAPGASLLAAARGERVALVGHEPWLSELLALLVTGETGDGARFELKKGAAALLEGTPKPGAMRLRALLPPRVLRKRRVR